MAEKSDKTQLQGSSAPSAPEAFFQNAPPPSYDETVNMNSTYPNPNQYRQQQSILQPSSYVVARPYQTPYGYANPYQMHIQQQQSFYNSPLTMLPTGGAKVADNVLYLAKGAKIRTTATGAISIPPPPPGCEPTAGQLAAMSGKPVVIKKQKKYIW